MHNIRNFWRALFLVLVLILANCVQSSTLNLVRELLGHPKDTKPREIAPAPDMQSSSLLRSCQSYLFPTAAASTSLKRSSSPSTRRLSSFKMTAAAQSQQQATTTTNTLEALKFNNTFINELPADPSTVNKPRQVFSSLYSFADPSTTNTEPTTIAASTQVARLIGLDPAETSRPEFSMIFSGQTVIPGTKPYAQCYGGHQFGNWAGQLGDGRAICLGEVVVSHDKDGEDRWELQLKGAGRTPYSRFADGRAVLRSSIREFLGSEFMAGAGIPTTRALSLILTGDQVMRDMFYNGNQKFEPGAVVCRVARSFIRFGSFQLPASRGGEDSVLVKQVADYVIKHHYPHILTTKSNDNDNNKYALFLEEVARRTAKLIAEWHRVGFVHGVLNTDNMSILGDTIDYGPYGFIERFDPDFTPNTTDLPGRRYAFANQPSIGQWNILQLVQAFLTVDLVTQDEATVVMDAYGEQLTESYHAAMAAKLGLKAGASYDVQILNDFLELLYTDSLDYTNTFRSLSSIPSSSDTTTSTAGDDNKLPEALEKVIDVELSEERRAAWKQWISIYQAALRAQQSSSDMSDAERVGKQNKANPAIIPRNHVMVGIIQSAEDGDYVPLQRYYEALERPYEERGVEEEWKEPAPTKSRMGVELLSCSS